MTFNLNGQTFTAREGQVFIITPGDILYFEGNNQQLKSETLVFSYDFLFATSDNIDSLQLFQFGSYPVLTLSDTESKKITSLFNTLHLYTNLDSLKSTDTIQYIILAIVSDISYLYTKRVNSFTRKAGPTSINIATQFLKLVSQQYLQTKSIAEYAQQMALSSKHLSETMKVVTGKPAVFWINFMLLQEAQIQLKQTRLSIAQISNSLGFSDQSSFGKFFKRHLHISPIHYRKRRIT